MVPQLNNLFGEHTFFLDTNGLSIIEPTQADETAGQCGQVVNLADWSAGNPNRLEPHEPKPTEVVITLESEH